MVAEARRRARAALVAAPCPGKGRRAAADAPARWAKAHTARVRPHEDFRIGPRTYRAGLDDDLPFLIAAGLGDPLGWPRTIERGTDGQRAVYQPTVLENEINNGGFQQYFDNSSGSITQALAGARLVGATEYARLFAEAGRRRDGDLRKLDDRYDALDARRGCASTTTSSATFAGIVMRSFARSSAVALVALACAACGGDARDEGPKLAQEDAAPLIFLSNQVARYAATNPCRARRDIEKLQARAIRLVTTDRVPAALKEDFLAGVTDLATHPVPCAPPRAPAPAPVTTTQEAKDHGKEKGKGHGKRGHKEKDD
ncbi:MAG TPA: DUF4375 domain-containing protein [Gaiellaceae bacterium]